MKKYAKVVNEETKTCDVALGTDINFYIKLGFKLLDVEQAYNGNWYLEGYAPIKPEPTIPEQVAELENQVEILNRKLVRDIRVILNPNANAEEKAQAQEYYNEKMERIDGLIEQINELKN